MAALTIDDVTTTLSLQDMDYTTQGKVKSFPTIAFGNGAKTYDTYGVPVPDFRKLGLKKPVKRLRIDQPPNGYVYRYDPTVRAANPVAPYGTIRIFQVANNLLVKGGVTADEDLGLLASGPTLGKLAATDRTILAADYATKGGVVPSPLVEVPATHAPAATVLELEVVG